MGADTAIEWCDHTFNPWIGCTKLTAACDHCYAESLALRWGWAEWGAGKPRQRTSEANWLKPIAWDRAAAKAGVRRRVFCASLADVFDAEVPDAWRDELFARVVMATPALDWLLLTKRPQVAAKWFAAHPAPANVWLGTTVENQKMADLRIPILLSVTGIAKRFLSCEPLLGPLDLTALRESGWHRIDALNGLAIHDRTETVDATQVAMRKIDWVIAGGESGHGARPPMIGWVRSLRDQCAAAGVAFHFKQWGEFTPDDPTSLHTSMRRVGKAQAGAMLDGRLHREFPT